MLKWFLLLFPLTLLSGCLSGGVGGSDFTMDKFLKNPIVMIAIGLIVVWYLLKHKK